VRHQQRFPVGYTGGADLAKGLGKIEIKTENGTYQVTLLFA
jgi:hypothetical protein